MRFIQGWVITRLAMDGVLVAVGSFWLCAFFCPSVWHFCFCYDLWWPTPPTRVVVVGQLEPPASPHFWPASQPASQPTIIIILWKSMTCKYTLYNFLSSFASASWEVVVVVVVQREPLSSPKRFITPNNPKKHKRQKRCMFAPVVFCLVVVVVG